MGEEVTAAVCIRVEASLFLHLWRTGRRPVASRAETWTVRGLKQFPKWWSVKALKQFSLPRSSLSLVPSALVHGPSFVLCPSSARFADLWTLDKGRTKDEGPRTKDGRERSARYRDAKSAIAERRSRFVSARRSMISSGDRSDYCCASGASALRRSRTIRGRSRLSASSAPALSTLSKAAAASPYQERASRRKRRFSSPVRDCAAAS